MSDVTLSDLSGPTANAGSDAEICAGTSTTLSASGGTNYTWSPSTGLSATNIVNPIANPNTTTTYTVTVEDSNGCVDIDDVTISVDELPNITSISSTNPACLQSDGTIAFSFPNNPNRTSIEFSIDGGSTYPPVSYTHLTLPTICSV